MLIFSHPENPNNENDGGQYISQDPNWWFFCTSETYRKRPRTQLPSYHSASHAVVPGRSLFLDSLVALLMQDCPAHDHNSLVSLFFHWRPWDLPISASKNIKDIDTSSSNMKEKGKIITFWDWTEFLCIIQATRAYTLKATFPMTQLIP